VTYIHNISAEYCQPSISPPRRFQHIFVSTDEFVIAVATELRPPQLDHLSITCARKKFETLSLSVGKRLDAGFADMT
jgi:hypothetical protein